MSRRTILNCKLRNKYGIEIIENKCDGVRIEGEEPIKACKECKLNIWYEEVANGMD